MSSIPDITDAEHWAVHTTISERWPGKAIEIQSADVEIKMSSHDRQVTLCPALFWEVSTTSFVIIKTGEKSYRCQFYYRGYQQYGTGKSAYDDIADCVTSLLQVHADKEKNLVMEKEQS